MIDFLQGDVFDNIKKLDDNTIDCVVTSPPYWGLRDYGVDGQLGLEKTYQEHIQNIVELFRAMKPKLKDSATVWLNYGDSYASTVNGTKVKDIKNDDRGFVDKPFSTIQGSLKPKDLVMIPNRIAIALQDDGWWIRSEIIWHKPNPMPESTKDRPTSCHEKIWLITKSKKYYYDADAIREPTTDSYKGKRGLIKKRNKTQSAMKDRVFNIPYHPSNTKNKRNVWTIPTKPCKEAHFATFPKDLIEPCIKAGCPENGIVFDPFGGSGTTGIVAKSLNRKAILSELNPEYIEIAKVRINKEFGMFK
jgi:DNA modification methylase